MAIKEQVIRDKYALYLGDACEALMSLPDESAHLSIYSPPFGGLYHYSSSPRDLSNADSYDEFFAHYAYVIRELYRLTLPGRVSCVHATDIPSGNTGNDHLIDFPGDVIRAHEQEGWRYVARYHVWKEPLGVRNRTMAKSLAHKTVVDDSSRCQNAAADYLLVFRKGGDNPVPIEHPVGLTSYAGDREPPADVLPWRGYDGDQKKNKFSHWVWRQYASAFWDDVRIDRVLPYREATGEDDEKHVHPLQLDVIERCLTLWSNLGEVVISPFMGVGSEVYGAAINGRRGVGIELKDSYFRQAIRNVEEAESVTPQDVGLFDEAGVVT